MDHTTFQDKAMASQRQLERLLKQVQRLNQRDEYWAATSRLARMWITPKHALPYRPLEVYQGEVQPADLTVSVPRVGGEAQVHLRLLEFDAIFREDHGV